MQEDADLVNFLSDTVKGKRYLEIKYVGYYNAKYNYILKIVEITPQHSYKRGTAPGMPYESFAVSAGASITYSAAFFASVANLLSLNDDLKAITCNIIAESYCMIRNKDAAKLYIAMSLRLVPTQIFARIKILDFLDGTKKSIMLAIKQLDRLIESQQTDLTYDLKLSKTFLQNKKTELQKWQSQ